MVGALQLACHCSRTYTGRWQAFKLERLLVRLGVGNGSRQHKLIVGLTE